MSNKLQDPWVIGLDVGTGSLGVALRHGNQIVESKTYLFDADAGSLADAAKKHRLWKTRQAHRAREFELNRLCEQAGIPVLKPMHAITSGAGTEWVDFRAELLSATDERFQLMTRESAAAGDSTVYHSAALRILLLEGRADELQPWQIYKALHSAIQRRGYGRVAWATDSGKFTEDDRSSGIDEDTTLRSASEAKFLETLPEPRYQFPAYYEAFQQGIWHPQGGLKVRSSIDSRIALGHQAEPVGLLGPDGKRLGIVYRREWVEGELLALLKALKMRFPSIDPEEWVYGKLRRPLQSIQRDFKGQTEDLLLYRQTWQGLLGQKVPRFDNRNVGACALIPRFKVCRAADPLFAEVNFLIGLHRFRFEDMEGGIRPINPAELRRLHQKAAIRDIGDSNDSPFSIGARALSALLKSEKLRLLPGHKPELIPSNRGGRCRFSRPALRLLKEFYLTGVSPGEFRERALRDVVKGNSNPMRGLTERDLIFLDLVANQTWATFFVPAVDQIQDARQRTSQERVRSVLSQHRGGKVRLRLQFLESELRRLGNRIETLTQGAQNAPDHVVLEIVREDFVGQKAKKEIKKRQQENEKERKAASQALQDAGLAVNAEMIRRYRLANAQKFKHLILPPGRGNQLNFGINDLRNLEIAHIWPESKGGGREFGNTFLLDHDLNHQMGARTPYEWLSGDADRWNYFLKSVRECDFSPSHKELLLSPDAGALVERREHLVATSWIARSTRSLCEAVFGWPVGLSGQSQRVVTLSGGVTASIRRRFKLNELLHDSQGNDDDSIKKKNRENPLHHALDAMVLTFLPRWLADRSKRESFKFPFSDIRTHFEVAIESTVLISTLRAKPALEENFYGQKTDLETGNTLVTRRRLLSEFGYARGIKPKYSLDRLKKDIHDLLPKGSLNAELEKLVQKKPDEEEWKMASQTLRIAGSKVRRARTFEGDVSAEFKRDTAFRRLMKPKGAHRGQILYVNTESGKYGVRPIYVHESRRQAVIEVIRDPSLEIIEIVRTGDYFRLSEDIPGVCEAGVYRLNSLRESRQVEFSKRSGQKVAKNPRIDSLLRAGFQVLRRNSADK